MKWVLTAIIKEVLLKELYTNTQKKKAKTEKVYLRSPYGAWVHHEVLFLAKEISEGFQGFFRFAVEFENFKLTIHGNFAPKLLHKFIKT